MLHNAFRATSSPALRCSRASRFYTTRAAQPETSSEDVAAARTWLANLNSDTIPRNLCEVSFSRSSGPGGQNVNKYGLPPRNFHGPHYLSDAQLA